MSDLERLRLLTSQMHLEPSEDVGLAPLPARAQEAITVKKAILPQGGTIALLKTLLSSYCERNCTYCPFRSGRDFPRAAFTPDQFARLFDQLYHSGLVEGIFLSSSIFQGSITTQDRLLDTARILRTRYHFKGYLHLKIMPGAEQSQIEEAMRLADRLSVNLEGPHPAALSLLAPQKSFGSDLIRPLQWIQHIRSSADPTFSWKGTWPSSTTQFVVGAAGESDLDILGTTRNLQQSSQISRAYFSSFNPFPDTPLESLPPSPPRREFRLYQAFYLLRDYGFDLEDLIYHPSGNLPLDIDPKSAWAQAHLLHKPLEINTAPREQLLRVPGIGPARAARILELRRFSRLRSHEQLLKAGLVTRESAPYLLTNGRSPTRQLALF